MYTFRTKSFFIFLQPKIIFHNRGQVNNYVPTALKTVVKMKFWLLN